ncbi:MAG: winged helix-turn-helix domain-containing protein [Pseudomonadota bacterium]
MSARILIVEDEPAIAELLAITLTRNGHTPVLAADAPGAERLLGNQGIDLALVDWMLPGVSGLELIKRMRRDAVTKTVPVIMLTARGEEGDVIKGLDAGADDYVGKPFSPRELMSRINALLRRTGAGDDGVLAFANLTVDLAAHRAYVDGDPVALGQREFQLLKFLAANPERVYSRAQLLDHVWGRSSEVEERTVDVHVLRLRKALKPGGADALIQTVRGAGYRLGMP